MDDIPLGSGGRTCNRNPVLTPSAMVRIHKNARIFRYPGIPDNTLMERCCTDIDLTVYDFFQKSRNEKQRETWKKEQEVKAVDRDAYYALVRKRKEEAEARFRRNGHARY